METVHHTNEHDIVVLFARLLAGGYCPSATLPAAPLARWLRASGPQMIITDANIYLARDAWLADPAETAQTYGNISDWNTSLVTNMSYLFCAYAPRSACNTNASTFNDDISRWDTSSVTDMSWMFRSATSFNQPLSFNTSSVTDMSCTRVAARGVDVRWECAWGGRRRGDVVVAARVHSCAGGGASRATPQLRSASTAGGRAVRRDRCCIGAHRVHLPLAGMFRSASARWWYAVGVCVGWTAAWGVGVAARVHWRGGEPCDTTAAVGAHRVRLALAAMFDYATSFNQPLSFDTSSVTDMSCTREAEPCDATAAVGAHRVYRALAAMFYNATSFNQPLSFDTSSVTDMSWILR
ncbi:hypothetical protein AB1Y20_017785 [Prymnesium parvum]|uniref:BspA family leucine-rich repeat surface protein n=1 Tax=Prymnesium parvum TaxID=97485 RepID=A0AB34JMR1_PRYPA